MPHSPRKFPLINAAALIAMPARQGQVGPALFALQ